MRPSAFLQVAPLPSMGRGRGWGGFRLIFAALALLLAAWPGPGFGQAGENRIALVIGNADYRGSPLRNPVNDARAMAQVLKATGFRVILRENASHQAMQRAVIEFGTELRNNGGVGLFYYAGHGVQVKGVNYLVPVNAAISSEEEVAVESLDVNYVLARMDGAKNRLNIVILDACRNNPFARSFRSSAGGLASIDAPAGTLIAYATAPGSVANDGDGKNGLYTGELVEAVKLPGLKVEDVFKQVRIRVQRLSSGQQVPWESSSLTGDFYFSAAPPSESAQIAALVPPPPLGGAPELSVRLNSVAYKVGDRMEIGIEAARPTYLSVYRWLPHEKGEEQVSRLFPNTYDPISLVSGAASIPSPDGKAKYELVMAFPTHETRSRQVEERLVFLASDRPLNLAESYSLESFNALLKSLPADEVRRIDRAYLLRR